MPNTIRPSLSAEVEAIAEMAIGDSQKQALQEIAQMLSVQSPNRASQAELKEPDSAVDKGGKAAHLD